MKTRLFLSFLFSLFFLFTGGNKAFATEPVIRVGLFPNVTHAQALIARNMSREGKGWFESRLNAKVEWYVFNAGPSAMESIFARSLDLTYVGPSPAINAYTRSNGAEIRVLSGSMKGGAALVVYGDQIQDAAGLKGKVIATPQLGNTQDVECRAWLLDQGLKVTLLGGDVRVIPTENPDIISLFMQGKLAGAWTVEPWVTRLIDKAGGRILYQDNDTVTTILVARTAYLTENPELVKKFVKAHQELTEWIKANPEEAQRRVRDEISFITKGDLQLKMVQEAWVRLHPETAITLAPFEKFLDRAQRVGLLKMKPNLSNLLPPSP